MLKDNQFLFVHLRKLSNGIDGVDFRLVEKLFDGNVYQWNESLSLPEIYALRRQNWIFKKFFIHALMNRLEYGVRKGVKSYERKRTKHSTV